jgi:NADPH:quinone reductase-like Zn-dependent oxidoreductase
LREVKADPQVYKAAKDYIYNELKAGRLKPKIDRTFLLEEIVDSHRYLESNQQFGKIVVEV